MDHSKDLVTVVIPTFNRSELLRRAVESCIKQNYRELEIIIVDDASCDNTQEVVNSFGDPRIRYIRHERNSGLSAARNTGIRNANGEFIAFLDDDDEWLPSKIESQIKIFKQEYEKIGLVFTNAYEEETKKNFFPDNMPSGIYYDPHNDKFFPLRKVFCVPSTWLLPAKVIKDVGDFDVNISVCQDMDYLARVGYKYPLYFLNEILAKYHYSAEQIHRNIFNAIRDKEVFIRKHHEFLKKDKIYFSRYYRIMGKMLLSSDKKKARQYLFKALLLRPLDTSIISKIIKTF
ncbi:MAG: glycosyltransferase family 2 protein [Candidatus Omnitrophica bacterium]|nr:glycosyltransferase family 2 protein [Candidatus Omnitrophota bacterium]